MNHLIVLRGYPASGKSTVGRELEALGAGTFIDHNYLMSVVSAMAGEDDGIYAELSRLELAMARKHLSEEKSAILDGTYATKESLMPLAALVESTLIPLVVFRLDAPLEVLRRRNAELGEEGMAPELLDRWLAEHPYQPWYGEHIMEAEGDAAALARTIMLRLP